MKQSGLSILLLTALLLTGCTVFTSTPEEPDNFELLVSDQPTAIDGFDYLHISITEARLFPQNGNGFEEIPVGGQTVDLTQVTGTRAESLVNTSIKPGNYSKIELHIGSVDGLVGGIPANVSVPSSKLMITKDFSVVDGEITRFVFDIEVVQTNATDRYNLLPVISESGVIGRDVEARPPGTRGQGPSITVGPPVGENQVVVNGYIDQPGYVVIHADENSTPGAVVGNSLLLEGEFQQIFIDINSSASSSNQYHAMLHYDDGDSQYTSPGNDTPVQNQGEIVVEPFTAEEQEPPS